MSPGDPEAQGGLRRCLTKHLRFKVNESRPQRDDSKQSPHTGWSAGIWAGAPSPTHKALPLAGSKVSGSEQGWGRDSQSSEGTGTTHPIVAVAVQIHFLGNLVLHTKRAFHLQRLRTMLSKARGPGGCPLCFRWKQLHPLSPSRVGRGTTQTSTLM